MSPLATVLVIGNSAFIVFILVALAILIRASSRFDFYLGVVEIQEPMKWLILRVLMIIIFTGLIAAVFNLGLPLFTPLFTSPSV